MKITINALRDDIIDDGCTWDDMRVIELNDIFEKLNSFNSEFLCYICCKYIIVIEAGHILMDSFVQIINITKIIDVFKIDL